MVFVRRCRRFSQMGIEPYTCIPLCLSVDGFCPPMSQIAADVWRELGICVPLCLSVDNYVRRCRRLPQMDVGSLVSVSLCAYLWIIMSADAADYRRCMWEAKYLCLSVLICG
jgi:hypothetical protein